MFPVIVWYSQLLRMCWVAFNLSVMPCILVYRPKAPIRHVNDGVDYGFVWDYAPHHQTKSLIKSFGSNHHPSSPSPTHLCQRALAQQSLYTMNFRALTSSILLTFAASVLFLSSEVDACEPVGSACNARLPGSACCFGGCIPDQSGSEFGVSRLILKSAWIWW